MQRNKVVFDSAAALTAALNSPVREEMRADYKQFPPFTNDNVHYPLATLEIRRGARMTQYARRGAEQMAQRVQEMSR